MQPVSSAAATAENDNVQAFASVAAVTSIAQCLSRPHKPTNQQKHAHSDQLTYLDTSSFIMHAAALLLLHASLLLCCTLLVKTAQFAAGCWRAHRRFSDSPIPSPKPASRLLGQSIVLQFSMHGRSAAPGAAAHTRCMQRNCPACLQDTFSKSWGPRMPGSSHSGQTRMAPYTSSECSTTFCWSARTQTPSSSSHAKEVRSGILAPPVAPHTPRPCTHMCLWYCQGMPVC